LDFTLRNVILGATVLGLVSGTLGAFALLRRQSLLGDALSHAALPGICLGFLVSGVRELLPLLVGALVTGVAAALVMLLVTRRSRVKEDAALGLVLSVFFAVGVVLLTYIQGRADAGQAGLDTFLFGQAAATLPKDVAAMALLGVLALGVVVAMWKELKLVTFDPGFAASLGLPVVALDVLLTTLVAFAVVIGLQMVGVVLMSAMLIAPAAAARQWTDRLGVMVILSAGLAVLGGVTGAVVSARGSGLATGPVMVLSVTAIVLLSLLFAPGRGLVFTTVARARSRHRLRAQTVLVDLYRLAERHDDPEYPAEVGMVRVLTGRGVRRRMRTLVAQGWARPLEHMPEEGPHFALTPEGRREAERVLARLGGER
jgi:manganese/zinc/iron transport system permease protein